MGDHRDDLAAAHERPTDPDLSAPPPEKTLAELNAEETVMEHVDDADARAPFVGWMALIGGVLITLHFARACWGR